MKKYYLGIDLGTSSIKGIIRSTDGVNLVSKVSYTEISVPTFLTALKCLINDLSGKISGETLSAISFSSQVGTYIVDGKDIISWQSPVGKEQLQEIKAVISQDEFIENIGMPHPDMNSYPLPRFKHIKDEYGDGVEVVMPKEILIRALTGNTVTDVFSYRGLANPKRKSYPDKLLKKLGINFKLPTLKTPFDLAGFVTETAEKEFGIKQGTPVYVGCNDFFAGLLGMGVVDVGTAFDLSGTSEHIGYISDTLIEDGIISGGYFNGYCTYGGTKSSGVSCDFAIKNFDINSIDINDCLTENAPIFLPYLNGERAPVFDENARGVYFGLNGKTDAVNMAYATLEGVVFSLYDIAKSLNMPTPKRLICGGGSAKDKVMLKLKAELFGCEVVRVKENDTSALGACLIAMIADGVYKDIRDAIEKTVEYTDITLPNGLYREKLLKRFDIYRSVYKNLKETFVEFNKIKEK